VAQRFADWIEALHRDAYAVTRLARGATGILFGHQAALLGELRMPAPQCFT
jgi:hypothetical protein